VSDPWSVTQFRTGTGAVNASPRVGPIVISEIMYRPISRTGTTSSEPAEEEFIELQNISTNDVVLYDLDYPTNTWKLDGGIRFVFPGGALLARGKVALVVVFDPVTNRDAVAAFQTEYEVHEDVRLVGLFEA